MPEPKLKTRQPEPSKQEIRSGTHRKRLRRHGFDVQPEGPRQNAIRVLLVDDEPILSLAISRMLETENGMEVETAANGLQGLEKYRKGQFDVIVSDMLMPVMNGLEMVTELRKIHPEAKVIILSGSLSPEIVERLAELGAVALSKPIEADVLSAAIEKCLR